jgi:hypothetical protein
MLGAIRIPRSTSKELNMLNEYQDDYNKNLNII